jgi:hypothetical protein
MIYTAPVGSVHYRDEGRWKVDVVGERDFKPLAKGRYGRISSGQGTLPALVAFGGHRKR